MKIFQPQYLCMKGEDITIDRVCGMPSNVYPNSETFGYHDFYELEYFEDGVGTHFINSVDFEVRKGYIYLLIPGDFHRMELDTDKKFKLWNLKVSASVITNELKDELQKTRGPICIYSDGEINEFILKELELLEECINRRKWNFQMAKNSAERILTAVSFAFEDDVNKGTLRLDGPMSKIIKYVENNYHNEINLSDVAKLYELTEGYAGIYFKKHTGMYFSDYLNRVRLFHSMRLLRETNKTVKEIAYSVGFNSPEYLTRLFKEAFGVSPREYRKSL